MDERFIRAFTDPAAQNTILGRLVSPFCLRHRVHLTALNSPFVKGGDIRALDILVAVKVMAGEPIGKLTNRELGEIMELNHDYDKMRAAALNINNHMLEANGPKFWQKDGKAGNNGVPWILNIIATLVSNGIDETRAWTMPECQAIWMSTAFATMKGADLKVLTTEDEEIQANFQKILNRN
jgi:hypothetical protein